MIDTGCSLWDRMPQTCLKQRNDAAWPQIPPTKSCKAFGSHSGALVLAKLAYAVGAADPWQQLGFIMLEGPEPSEASIYPALALPVL